MNALSWVVFSDIHAYIFFVAYDLEKFAQEVLLCKWWVRYSEDIVFLKDHLSGLNMIKTVVKWNKLEIRDSFVFPGNMQYRANDFPIMKAQ